MLLVVGRSIQRLDSTEVSPKYLHDQIERKLFVVKLRLREGEKIQDAVKRFRKLVEHSGIKKEMRRREYYEKPSDTARRSRRRAERRARLNRLQTQG